MKDVVYVGSGLSAVKVSEIKRENFTTCALNNAWRAFDGSPPDYWIHSGDLPSSHLMPQSDTTIRVGHAEIAAIGREACDALGIVTEFPQHEIGYTMFFQGLFWIILRLKPDAIFTLGMDHDYDPDRVKMWMDAGCPAPHNRYLGADPPNPSTWADEFFRGHEPDSFYGQGTPDPMRFGEQHIKDLFRLAEERALRLGVKVFNGSNRNGLNSFPKTDIPS